MLKDQCPSISDCGRTSGKRTPADEKKATSLLNEYQEMLLADKSPDPKDYFTRFEGSDRESLRLELNLATFLWTHRKEISQALRKLGRRSGSRKMESEVWKGFMAESE